MLTVFAVILVFKFGLIKLPDIDQAKVPIEVETTVMDDIDNEVYEYNDLAYPSEYVSDLNKASPLPDWYEEVELLHPYKIPTSYQEVNGLTNVYHKGGACCDKDDPAFILKNRRIAKILYQVVRDANAQPQTAAYALTELLTKEYGKDLDRVGLANFYIKYFYNTDIGIDSRAFRASDHVWLAVRMVARDLALVKRKPEQANQMIDELLEKVGHGLSPRHHFDAAYDMATYTTYISGRSESARFIVVFLNRLSGELASDEYYAYYNKLLKLCAIYDENACANFSKKTAPPLRPEHDPRLIPKIQAE